MSNVISKILGNQEGHSRAAWDPVRAVAGVFAAFVGSQLIVGIVLGILVTTNGWSDQQVDTWLSAVGIEFCFLFLTSILSLLLLYPFMMKYTRKQIVEGLGLAKPRLGIIGHGLLGVLIYFGIYLLVATIAQQFTPINVEQEQEIGFDNAKTTGSLLITFVSLVVIPPIMEEIMFRGFLYGGLRHRFTIVGSALITAVIFALPHAGQSTDGTILWIAAIDTFVLSLVLTYLREKTGSIYAGMFVHAVKNGVAFLFVFILS